MAETETKTDEVVEETTEATEESTEKATEESSKETETDVAELQAHTDFDKLIDDDEAEEAAEQVVEEKTETKTEEKTETEEKAAVEETPAEEETKVKADDTDSGKTEKAAETEDVSPDDSLLERAVKVGLPLGIAKSADPVQLEAEVTARETKAGEVEEEEVKPFDCGLDPADYTQSEIDLHNKIGQQAQDTKVAMDKMAADHKKDMDGVSAKSTAVSAEQARVQVDSMMDGFFNGMKGFEKTFGKGKIVDMEKGSPGFEKRMDIEDEMLALSRGYKASGKEVTDAELFKRAVGIVCPEEISKVALSTKKTKIEKQREQVIGAGGTDSDKAATKAEKVDKIQKDFDALIDVEDE